MSTCSKCGSTGSDSYSLARCDNCRSLRCLNCSTLSSSEHKGISVKKRSPCVSYHCVDCVNGAQNKAEGSKTSDTLEFQEILVSTIREGLDEFKKSLNIGDTCVKLNKALEVNTKALNSVIINMENLSKTTDTAKQSEINKVQKSQNIKTTSDKAECNEITNLKIALEELTAKYEAQQMEMLEIRKKLENLSGQLTKNIEHPNEVSASGYDNSLSNSNVNVNKPLTSTHGKSFSMDKHQKKNQEIVGLKKSCDGITASKPQTSIFVSRVSLEVNEEDINEYLKNTFGHDNKFITTRIDVRSGEYAAFKVCANKTLEDNLLNPYNWPEDILVKKYTFFRSQRRRGSNNGDGRQSGSFDRNRNRNHSR